MDGGVKLNKCSSKLIYITSVHIIDNKNRIISVHIIYKNRRAYLAIPVSDTYKRVNDTQERPLMLQAVLPHLPHLPHLPLCPNKPSVL